MDYVCTTIQRCWWWQTSRAAHKTRLQELWAGTQPSMTFDCFKPWEHLPRLFLHVTLKPRKGDNKMEQTKVLLADRDIPRQWYNPGGYATPMRPPFTRRGPARGTQDLAPIFPMNLIELEVSGSAGSISRKRFW
jgi:hypothetical protein